MENVGKNIAQMRKQLGMTQKELAERVGYKSLSTIAKIEAGVNDLPQSKLAQIAEVLQTTPAVLMGWVSVETSKKNSAMVDATKRMRSSEAYFEAVMALSPFTDDQLRSITQMLKTMS